MPLDADTRRAVDKLTRELATLNGRIGRVENGLRSMQLSRSSLENTAIVANDENGNQRQRVGKQEDGRFTSSDRNGPAPPQPEPPSLFAMAGGLRVTVNGGFVDANLPSDFGRWEIHVDLTDGFTVSDQTLDATIANAKGGAANFLTTDLVTHYVRVVAVNTSGVRSAPSSQRSVTPLEAGGGVNTYFTGTEPSDPDQGDLWLDSSRSNRMFRWDGSSWVEVRDEGIAQAIQDADAAQQDATQAINDAADAQATADSKVTTFYQSTQPTATGVGDMWVDTDTDRLFRWDGSAWIEIQDEDIAQAISDAQTAQNTADSKIVSFFQDTEPTGGAIGDIWYDTSDGNRAHWWTGSSWSEVPVGTGAIAPGAATTEIISDGAVDNSKLADESIDDRVLRTLITLTSRLVAGSPTGARVELNGSGLEAFNSGGTRTVFLNAADGSALFTGTIEGSTFTGGTITGPLIRTSSSGQRVALESDQTRLVFYDPSGRELAEAQPHTDETGSDAFRIVSHYSDGAFDEVQMSSFADTRIAHWNSSGSEAAAIYLDSALGVTVTGTNTDASPNSSDWGLLNIGNDVGDHIRIDTNEIMRMTGTSTPGRLYLNGTAADKGGDVVQAGRVRSGSWPEDPDQTDGSHTFIRSTNNSFDSAIHQGVAQINVRTWDGSGLSAINASNIGSSSSRDGKQDITEPAFDPMDLLGRVAIKQFRRRPSQEGKEPGRVQFGPVAEEMPQELVTVVDEEDGGDLVVNPMDLISVLWTAVQQLDAKVTELTAAQTAE